MASLMPALIETRGVRKSFGEHLAVAGVDLEVEGGELYGLLGPDGAGKTTMIRLLCGALIADSGSIQLAGHDIERETDQARAQIGYLAQRFSLYGDLTVRENLQFFAQVRGLPRSAWEARANEILVFVGLEEFAGRRADALSGGMKQKLGLATALVHRPKILLLDEPTGGVDPVTRQSFWQLLVRLLRQGVAVLMTTPYMDEAARCTRVGFMQAGRILLEGTPTSIAARLEGQVIELVGHPRRAIETAAGQDPEIEAVQTYGDRFHLRVGPGQAEAVVVRFPALVQTLGGQVDSLHPIAPTLEDVFIAQIDAGPPADPAKEETHRGDHG